MNITLTITATPQLFAILEKFVGGLTTPAAGASVEDAPKQVVKEVVKEQPDDSTSGEKITVEELRALVKSKNQNDKVKAILTKLGAASVSALESKDYADFKKQVNEL
jgi:benzoyl-CoA reductase/2-hydroxyglutaryl-CoA dehydratase subunit BcrC/BadD/HgdB